MSIIYSFSNTNKMKDSEKKAKNLYNCHQCGNTIVTEDIDDGVTPSSLPCSMFNGCKTGRMWSFGYNVPPVLVASHEWFSKGGEALDIRKITEIRESPFNATGVPKKEVISGGGIASGRTKYHEKFNPKKNKK